MTEQTETPEIVESVNYVQGWLHVYADGTYGVQAKHSSKITPHTTLAAAQADAGSRMMDGW